MCPHHSTVDPPPSCTGLKDLQGWDRGSFLVGPMIALRDRYGLGVRIATACWESKGFNVTHKLINTVHAGPLKNRMVAQFADDMFDKANLRIHIIPFQRDTRVWLLRNGPLSALWNTSCPRWRSTDQRLPQFVRPFLVLLRRCRCVVWGSKYITFPHWGCKLHNNSFSWTFPLPNPHAESSRAACIPATSESSRALNQSKLVAWCQCMHCHPEKTTQYVRPQLHNKHCIEPEQKNL